MLSLGSSALHHELRIPRKTSEAFKLEKSSGATRLMLKLRELIKADINVTSVKSRPFEMYVRTHPSEPIWRNKIPTTRICKLLPTTMSPCHIALLRALHLRERSTTVAIILVSRSNPWPQGHTQEQELLKQQSSSATKNKRCVFTMDV